MNPTDRLAQQGWSPARPTESATGPGDAQAGTHPAGSPSVPISGFLIELPSRGMLIRYTHDSIPEVCP